MTETNPRYTFTYQEVKEKVLNELDYAKNEKFQDLTKIEEKITLSKDSGPLVMIYEATEKMSTAIGPASTTLKYSAMGQDHLLELCKRSILAGAGITESVTRSYKVTAIESNENVLEDGDFFFSFMIELK